MESELSNMTVGHTKVINGHAVTRWSERAFEVDTWGRTTVNVYTALEMVASAHEVRQITDGPETPFSGGPGSGKSYFPETYRGRA